MSKISTIIDTFRTRLSTVLPDHKELPYNRQIEMNSNLYLDKGYAFSTSTKSHTNRSLSCRISQNMTAIITVTRLVFAHDRDIEKRVLVEKTLYEDQFLLINDLQKDADLSSSASNVSYVSDNGIEDVFSNETHFLMIQSTFDFEYFDNLV